MPDKFDLLKICYMDTRDEERKVSNWFAYAPVYKVQIGDIVETGFGRAVVMDKATFIVKDEAIFRLINGTVPIDRVLFKVQLLRYEDDV